MGVIVQTILALKDRYDYVLRTSIDINTGSLERDMENLVFKSFSSLRPLASDFHNAVHILTKNGEYSYEHWIAIGEFIRWKYSESGYGSNYNEGSEYSRGQFFNIIREYGEQLTGHVNLGKRSDFGKLVELTKSLKPYDELVVSLEVDPPIMVHGHRYEYSNEKFDTNHFVKILDRLVKVIHVRTADPKTVVLMKAEKENEHVYYPEVIDIDNEAHIGVVEDLMDHLVSLYAKAYQDVAKTRSHNEPLTTEMDTLASAYKVSKCLT
jgi:hypothetical protein